MKRLPPKIVLFFLFAAVTATVSATNFQDPDSLKLFRDITDISRQIEKQTLSSDYPQDIDPQQPVVVLQNQDSLFSEKVTDEPLLQAWDSTIYRNPLDSLYFIKYRCGSW